MGLKEYTIMTRDELVEVVSESLNQEDKAKLVEVCNDLGLYDTINLLDERTLQLISLYKFYKNAPHLVNNSIFFEAFNILSEYEIRMF